MEQLDYIRRFSAPTVIEVWTPTCSVCRAMEPDLQATAAEFAGRVNLVQIDASSDLDIARELGVSSAPTLIGVSEGIELFRTTGRRNTEELDSLFSLAAKSSANPKVLMSQSDRLVRTMAGVLVAAVGLGTGPSWVLIAVGIVILAWSVPGWFALIGS